MKRFLVVAILLLVPVFASAEPKHEPKDKFKHKDHKTVPVPEPATISLLAVGAGALVARKVWARR